MTSDARTITYKEKTVGVMLLVFILILSLQPVLSSYAQHTGLEPTSQTNSNTELIPNQTNTSLESALSTSTNDNLIVFKTYQNNDLKTMPLPPACDDAYEDCESQTTDHKKPENSPVAEKFTTVARTDLIKVDNPQQWPYSPTIKMFSFWPSGAISTCSGMLIEAKHMLTAAHCVYSYESDYCNPGETSCWVEDIEIIPGYSQGNAPLGKTGYDTILTWTAWTEHKDNAYNLAAIELRYPLGAYIGWLGFGFNNETNFFQSRTFYNTAYPHENPYDGEDIYGWTGNIDVTDAHTMTHNNYSYSGQNGAALYDHGSKIVAYGVLSEPNNAQHTVYTRINYDKFDAIRTFITEGRPKDMGNLLVFNVNAKPQTAFPGQILTSLNFFIYNHSDVPIPDTAEYQIEIFLSPNFDVTSEYHILGTFNLTNTFPANSGERITPAIDLFLPEDIQHPNPIGGTYYLGATLKLMDETETEINRSNYHQTQPIWIYNNGINQYRFPIFGFGY